MLHRAATT